MVKLAFIPLALILTLGAQCVTNSGGGGFCDIAVPYRPSAAEIAAMTPARKKAVLAHNLKGQELCGWKP